MSFGSHLLAMSLYAIGTGAFFALLWKDDTKGQARVFATIVVSLLAGGTAVAVLMEWIFNR